MPLPIIRTVTETTNSTNTTSFTVNMPSSRPNGRLYVMLVQVDGGDQIADPSGWTRIQRSASGAATAFWAGYRIGSSEPATYSVATDASASESWNAIVLGVDRFNSGAPIDTSSVNTGTSTTPTSTGITTTVNDCLVIWGLGHDEGSKASTTASPWPSAYAPISSVRSSSTQGVVAAGYTTQVAAGAVSGVAGATITSDEWVVSLFAIAGDLNAPEVTSFTAAKTQWIANSEAGVVLTGVGFEASKGSGKLELWSDASGTTKVVQTTSAWSATSITFTASRSTIAAGRMYAVVTTNGGLVSEPFRVVVLDGNPDVKIAQVRVSANTSTGNQDITTSDLGGATPKAVFLQIIRATADGTPDHISIGYGMATSSSARAAYAFASKDAVATTENFADVTNSQCLILLDPTQATVTREAAADFVSFLTNGCRINWSTAPASGYQVVATFFAGTQLQAHVSPLAIDIAFYSATVPYLQQVTTTIGDPDFLLGFTSLSLATFTTGLGTDGVALAAAKLSTFDLLASEQCAFSRYRVTDAVTTGALVTDVDTTGFLPLSTGAGLSRARKSYLDRDTGYTIYPSGGAPSKRSCGVLELVMPGLDSWVGSITASASTGSQSITSPGFSPQWVAAVQTRCSALGTSVSDDRANTYALASFTSTSAQSLGAVADDGASGSDSASTIKAAAIYMADIYNASATFDGTFTSFDSTGWTWNYSATAGARIWWGLAIEGYTAAAGTTTVTPSAVPIPVATPTPTVVRSKTLAASAVAIPVSLPAPTAYRSMVLGSGAKHYPARRRRRMYYGDLEFEEQQPEPKPRPKRRRKVEPDLEAEAAAASEAAGIPILLRPTPGPESVPIDFPGMPEPRVPSEMQEREAREIRRLIEDDEALLRLLFDEEN